MICRAFKVMGVEGKCIRILPTKRIWRECRTNGFVGRIQVMPPRFLGNSRSLGSHPMLRRSRNACNYSQRLEITLGVRKTETDSRPSSTEYYPPIHGIQRNVKPLLSLIMRIESIALIGVSLSKTSIFAIRFDL